MDRTYRKFCRNVSSSGSKISTSFQMKLFVTIVKGFQLTLVEKRCCRVFCCRYFSVVAGILQGCCRVPTSASYVYLIQNGIKLFHNLLFILWVFNSCTKSFDFCALQFSFTFLSVIYYKTECYDFQIKYQHFLNTMTEAVLNIETDYKLVKSQWKNKIVVYCTGYLILTISVISQNNENHERKVSLLAALITNNITNLFFSWKS